MVKGKGNVGYFLAFVLINSVFLLTKPSLISAYQTCSENGIGYRLCHSCSCDPKDCNQGTASNRCSPDDPPACTWRATGWSFCGGKNVYSVRYNKSTCTRFYTCGDSACYCKGGLGYKKVGSCEGPSPPTSQSCTYGGCEDWRGGCTYTEVRDTSCDSICSPSSPFVEVMRVRCKGGAEQSIAGSIDNPTSSKLRVRKGGTTYYVAIVDPSDPAASCVRIRISGGVKALRKL